MTSLNPVTPEKGSSKELTGRPMLIPIIFCLVCGVLLIVLRSLAVTITAWVLAGVMLICGVWSVILYKKSTPAERISGARLAIGLILLVAGILLALNPSLMDALLPKIWGLALLFSGFLKIQYAFDEKSVGLAKWWIMLILAALSIFIGIIALAEPVFLGTDDSKRLIIGILLVAEAILDICVFFLLKYALMKKENEEAAAAVAAAEAAAAAAQQAAEEAAAEAEAAEEAEETPVMLVEDEEPAEEAAPEAEETPAEEETPPAVPEAPAAEPGK